MCPKISFDSNFSFTNYALWVGGALVYKVTGMCLPKKRKKVAVGVGFPRKKRVIGV